MNAEKWVVIVRTICGFETSQTYASYIEAKQAEWRAQQLAEVGFVEVRRVK